MAARWCTNSPIALPLASLSDYSDSMAGPLSLKIVPVDDTVAMYGEPDRTSAYSLSGHVAVSLRPPLTSFCMPARSDTIHIESLVLTFEGQSELITSETGYSACRVYSASQELITGDALQLSHQWEMGSSEPCSWDIVFNLALPGWLPATSDGEAGIKYALYAEVKFRESEQSSMGWISRCAAALVGSSKSPMRARKCPIQVVRYTVPPPEYRLASTVLPGAAFHSSEFGGSISAPHSEIPTEIISKLQFMTYVPERVSVDDTSFPLCIRIRPEGIPLEDLRRIRIPGFSLEVMQKERYRTTPNPQYCAQFPVPPAEEQPPKKKLLDPHPLHTIFRAGLYSSPANYHCSREYSMLPPGNNGRHALGDDGYIFASHESRSKSDMWYTIRIDVPFAQHGIAADADDFAELRECTLHTSGRSPLHSVSHGLRVILSCTYDRDDSPKPERVRDNLNMEIPLHFVRVPPKELAPPSPEPAPARWSLGLAPSPSKPYAAALPAYSQLFYANGAQKEDPTPLPLYSLHPSAEDRPLTPDEVAKHS